MIISCSRRTDIPAFYGDWLLERLRSGYVRVRHPYNPAQIRSISLEKQDVDGFVFWTKHASSIGAALDWLDRRGDAYYFQYTLNHYPRTMEPGLPPLEQRLEVVRRLSRRIGRERIIWRYDPLLITAEIDGTWHLRTFEALCGRLAESAAECSVSFYVDYVKSRRRLTDLEVILPKVEQRIALITDLGRIAKRYGIRIRTCCTELPTDLGISATACVDAAKMCCISGHPLKSRKDPGQRPQCRCSRSVDIGAYNSCMFGCRYCYAGTGTRSIIANCKKHDPHADLLIP